MPSEGESDIRSLQRRIERIYQSAKGNTAAVPTYLQVIEWIAFANDYIAAASILDAQAPQHWLPQLQLTGQAVECALKACIRSVNVEPSKSHDLIDLYEVAVGYDFRLNSPDQAALVHLNHFYFQDVATGTRFKARYPTPQTERLGGAVPTNATFLSIVDRLTQQAARKNDGNLT